MRWLLSFFLRRILQWAGEGKLIEFTTHRTDDGQLYLCLTDAFGVHHGWEWTPDEAREYAWQLIPLADRAENNEYEDDLCYR